MSVYGESGWGLDLFTNKSKFNIIKYGVLQTKMDRADE